MAGNNNNSICIGFKPSVTDPTIAIPDPNDLNAIYVAERTCRHHRNKRHNATQTPDLGYPNWRKRHHPGGGGGIECCASSCCCYCCHCHCHPHHHCHGTTILPSNNQRQKNRLVAAKRLPELPSSKQSKLAPESSQSLSSPDDREDIAHHKHHQQQQQQQHHRHMHSRPHQQQRRHHNQCSRLPEKIPTGGTIAIEIDAATLTDDISYCSSISNNSFALAMANETTNSKDILVHCSGGGGGVDNHLPRDHRKRKSRTRAHHCGQKSSHIDSVCSTTSTTTEDEVIIVQRKCKRGGKFIARQETIDGAADVEEEDDDDKLSKSKPVTCCDENCCTALNEGVKIKRKNFTNRYYCSSCSKCSSCSCCQQEQDGQLHNSCSFSSSLSHIEDGDCDQIDDEVCSRCDAKPNVNGGEESDIDDAAGDHSSSQQSAESFCSCNSTSRCYCSCSCDESDTIRKESCTTTPITLSNVSTPIGPVGDCAAVGAIAGKNCAEDAFSMAGKSSVSQSEYFSLSSDKPMPASLASSPMSPPPTESVMPSPPALPRKHCKHYSKHHRHKSDGNFDSVL